MKYEFIGICGTILILIGFLSNSQKKIRIFDMLGSFCFVTYGILIGAYSNIILNGILIVIHLYKLHRIRGEDADGKEEDGKTKKGVQ